MTTDLLIRGGRLLDREGEWDIGISGDRIESIESSIEAATLEGDRGRRERSLRRPT